MVRRGTHLPKYKSSRDASSKNKCSGTHRSGTYYNARFYTEMGKHPDLMVGPPTPTIFPTIGRNYEISFFFTKNFEKVFNKTLTKRPTFGRNLPNVVNFGEKKTSRP